jgi:hypothetical protein
LEHEKDGDERLILGRRSTLSVAELIVADLGMMKGLKLKKKKVADNWLNG